jgi:hypothetical protein
MKEVKKLSFRPKDLTKDALERIVQELLAADEGQEQQILDRLSQREAADKETNDLADLVEEKRGKPNSIDPDDEPIKAKKRTA